MWSDITHQFTIAFMIFKLFWSLADIFLEYVQWMHELDLMYISCKWCSQLVRDSPLESVHRRCICDVCKYKL